MLTASCPHHKPHRHRCSRPIPHIAGCRACHAPALRQLQRGAQPRRLCIRRFAPSYPRQQRRILGLERLPRRLQLSKPCFQRCDLLLTGSCGSGGSGGGGGGSGATRHPCFLLRRAFLAAARHATPGLLIGGRGGKAVHQLLQPRLLRLKEGQVALQPPHLHLLHLHQRPKSR
jgi:hypothetical protein